MQLAYDINIVSFVALESLEFHNGIPRNSEVLKKKLSSFIKQNLKQNRPKGKKIMFFV